MLRNNKRTKQPGVCRENRFEEPSHQAKSKRENDSRDTNSSGIESSKRCRIPQLFRRSL